MTDIEDDIFSEAAARLREKFPDIAVYGELVLSPSEFPCACIEEADSYVDPAARDSSGEEKYTVLVYEVNVYSNRVSGKKAECKKIFSELDGYFNSIGFTRLTRNPISLDDSTKYRMFGRYTAVASPKKIIYRR